MNSWFTIVDKSTIFGMLWTKVSDLNVIREMFSSCVVFQLN